MKLRLLGKPSADDATDDLTAFVQFWSIAHFGYAVTCLYLARELSAVYSVVPVHSHAPVAAINLSFFFMIEFIAIGRFQNGIAAWTSVVVHGVALTAVILAMAAWTLLASTAPVSRDPELAVLLGVFVAALACAGLLNRALAVAKACAVLGNRRQLARRPVAA